MYISIYTSIYTYLSIYLSLSINSSPSPYLYIFLSLFLSITLFPLYPPSFNLFLSSPLLLSLFSKTNDQISHLHMAYKKCYNREISESFNVHLLEGASFAFCSKQQIQKLEDVNVSRCSYKKKENDRYVRNINLDIYTRRNATSCE